MSINLNIEQLKTFVKSELGCKCPDEVFFSVKEKQHYKIATDLELDVLFIIGNRLLIFIKSIQKMKQAKNNLETMVTTGRSWRDDDKLNRFRLVLIYLRPKQLEKQLLPIFKKLSAVDDKVHLHILGRGSIKSKEYSFIEL